MVNHGATAKVLAWARDFREGELSVDDIQNLFSELDVTNEVPATPVRRRIAEAQRELDAIRFGMCESGQRAEITRIFSELEKLIAERTDMDPR